MGSNLPCFALRVQWRDDVEHIELDFAALQEGGEYQAHDESERKFDSYVVVCKGKQPSEGRYVALMAYERDKNPAYKPRRVDWGVYEYAIDTKEMHATVRYIATGEEALRVQIVGNNLAGPSADLISRTRREGQKQLRDSLLSVDKFCAVTRESCHAVLDAVHIEPHAGRGAASIRNSFLLRADLHRLFDAKLLRIDPDSGEVWIEGIRQKGSMYDVSTRAVFNPEVLRRVQSALRLHRQGL